MRRILTKDLKGPQANRSFLLSSLLEVVAIQVLNLVGFISKQIMSGLFLNKFYHFRLFWYFQFRYCWFRRNLDLSWVKNKT